MENSAAVKNETNLEVVKKENETPILTDYKIFCPDEDKEITVTVKMQEDAEKLIHIQKNQLLRMASIIKYVFDNYIYLAMGCSTKQEYAEKYWGVSLRSAYRYYDLANKVEEKYGFALDLSKLEVHNETDFFAPVQKLSIGEVKLEEFGLRKLLKILNLPKEDFDLLEKEGKIITQSGKTLTLDDIVNQKTSDIEKEFAKERRALKRSNKEWQDKLHRNQEELSFAKEEKKALTKEIERLNTRVMEIMEIEKLYCTASLFEQKLRYLKEVKEKFDDAIYVLYNAGILPEDHEKLQRELLELIGHMNRGISRVMDVYPDVIPLALAWEIDVCGGNPGWSMNLEERERTAYVLAQNKEIKKEAQKKARQNKNKINNENEETE